MEPKGIGQLLPKLESKGLYSGGIDDNRLEKFGEVMLKSVNSVLQPVSDPVEGENKKEACKLSLNPKYGLVNRYEVGEISRSSWMVTKNR